MFHVKQIEEKIKILSCPVCEKTDIDEYLTTKDYFFTRESFTLSKCAKCNFVFTNPIPADLGKYYETEDYLSHNTKSGGIISNIYSAIRNMNIMRKYNLVIHYCTNGSILDIGCGTGDLLRSFKNHGWETTGIEPNKKAREIAQKQNDVKVFTEEKLNEFEDGKFDVVSMWHVLEHVEDINERMKQVSRLTSTHGTMIFALPNLNSPDAKKYGHYWSGLDVPRHLYHFTQETFEKLATKHGLKLVHAEPMKFDAYYVSMLSEKYRGNKYYLPAAFLNGLVSNIKAKSKNNYSSMIFVCKKSL